MREAARERMGPVPSTRSRRLKVLYFCEGFTDIRFVVGLSEICELTMAVPARSYRSSGLSERVQESGAAVRIDEIPGGRFAFQARSFLYLWREIRQFDVVLSQEVLRGSLNATLIGAIRGVPVVMYLGIAPLEYFKCRRERRQIGLVKAIAGEAFIRMVTALNGRLATRCLAMGPYLRDIAAKFCPRSDIGLYYGVDVDVFKPADAQERAALRRRHGLPVDKFLVLLSSRMSHEKDPETVLKAVALARAQGLDAIVLNLGGGYQEFLQLARHLSLSGPNDHQWVYARPAVHPMRELADFFRAADVAALASLAEGAAYSTLEALACGTPVVATEVGGMAVQLKDAAQLTPRRDAEAMAEAILRVARHPEEARRTALKGREYVCTAWRREKAFNDLRVALEEARDRPT